MKIIKDRDDKPKGFGYIEFVELDGLKDALARSGEPFQNRPIRVSVASPQQSKFASEDDKFDQPWRRDGPLPPRNDFSRSSRFEDGQGSRFKEDKPPSASETVSDWRSNRAPAPPRFDDGSRPPRRSGLATPTGEPSPADSAENWTKGSKFTPSQGDTPPRGKFGSLRSERGDISAPPYRREPIKDESASDWRSVMRPTRPESTDKSPSTSTPPTPQLGRRKLELAPRSASGGNSTTETPLASPKMRSNPFGAAKPVDVSARENEVAERLQKDRENLAKTVAEKSPNMGRTPSKSAREREPVTILQPSQQKESAPSSPVKSPGTSSVVRPTFSFANAASNKKTEETTAQPTLPSASDVIEEERITADVPVDEVTAQIQGMTA